MATATKAKAEKATNECECGCGMPTMKRFAIGHDARFKSALYSIIRGEDPKVVAPASEGLTKVQATKILEKNGWPMPADRKPKAERKAPAKPAAAKKAPAKSRTKTTKVEGEDLPDDF